MNYLRGKNGLTINILSGIGVTKLAHWSYLVPQYADVSKTQTNKKTGRNPLKRMGKYVKNFPVKGMLEKRLGL